MSQKNSDYSRRDFLKTGVAAAFAAGLIPPLAGDKKNKDNKIDPKKILNYHPDMAYRRLGKTDVYLSVISLGGIGIDKSVLLYAIDKGVNLVHTSSQYNGGNSIRMLGEVLKTKRDRVYVALKDTFSNIDDDLKTLNTEYVDFLMFNRHSPDKVLDPEIFEDFAKYRKQGKARYAGLTTHDHVKECVAAGVQSGRYAIIQPVLNQNAFEAMQTELRQAAESDVGIMGMKTMQGIFDLNTELAYLKKLLGNPAVATVSKVLRNYDHVNAYIKAAKETLSASEDMSLYRYASMNRQNTCMMCGACETACPSDIRISAILRAKTYYKDQLGDMETAYDTYRQACGDGGIGRACTACGKCETACPNGIAIVDRLHRASRFFQNRRA
jgi:predicted aldo/keto reductase-like oxidoreductase